MSISVWGTTFHLKPLLYGSTNALWDHGNLSLSLRDAPEAGWCFTWRESWEKKKPGPSKPNIAHHPQPQEKNEHSGYHSPRRQLP